MADYLTLGRPLTIQTPLPPDAVLLAGLTGREALNELFSFQFHLLAPTALPPLAYPSLLGHVVSATIRIGPGGSRIIAGTVMALEQAERDRDFTHFHATIRPAWWLATLRTNSRIFQQKTAPEILEQVLSPFGKLDRQLTSEYPQRDYTCQYQETDWTFACRILEEEGIFFYFTHAEDGPTLVLADTVASIPKVDMLLPIRYSPDDSTSERQYRCVRWNKTQRVVPTTVTVWDNHMEYYRQNLAARASVPPQATAGAVTHQPALPGIGDVPVYDHRGDYAKRYDGVSPGGGNQSASLQGVMPDSQRTAKLRAEAFATASVQMIGEGDAYPLTPGYEFTLEGHYDADGQYLVAAVEHTVEATGTFRAGQPLPEFTYRNRWEARPMDWIPRPACVTPRPRIGGPLTAVVVGPPGQELFLDKYGRIKVQFFWDRDGQNNAGSSCWIRCAQLWAGKSWGAFFWPRIGMEVVVHFEDGDPDRPIVTGCVYNATNMPPTQLPAESTVGGIKSCIVFGNPATNFNAVLFHDTPGVEYVQVHSERGEIQRSETGKYHYTGTLTFNVQGHL
ncbi:MAG: type VI secretion system tip protein VgrG [Bacteroidales bacterium]|nr:type VI secretion system tip protein VgrG [Bacteroidales bacterium]